LSFQKACSIALNIQEIDLPEKFKYSTVEILGCDSIFEFNGRAFGKPSDKQEAYRRWSKMSGEFGFLHTGHTLLFSTFDSRSKMLKVTKKIKKTVSSKVYFSKLQDEEIKSYVDSLEPLNCAGGFALEGKGGKYIEKIEGCFSNVMGLSLPWLRKSLIKEGIFP
jgi:septum formation protein